MRWILVGVGIIAAIGVIYRPVSGRKEALRAGLVSVRGRRAVRRSACPAL
jgi:hypothetical protein